MKQYLSKIFVGIAIASICYNLYQCDNGRDFKTELRDVRLRIRAKEHERDSMYLNLKSTRDSLKIAFNTITVAHNETDQAKKDKLKAIKYYESIIYVRFANDTLRGRAITDLYPSYGHP